MCHRVYRVSSLCHSRIPVLYKCRLFQKECAFHEIRTALAKRSMKEKNTSYNNDGRHFEKAFSRSNIHWPLVTKKNGFCCSICRFAQLLRPQIVSLAFPRLFFQCAKHRIVKYSEAWIPLAGSAVPGRADRIAARRFFALGRSGSQPKIPPSAQFLA